MWMADRIDMGFLVYPAETQLDPTGSEQVTDEGTARKIKLALEYDPTQPFTRVSSGAAGNDDVAKVKAQFKC